MSLEEELLAELKALRAGTGLTESRLREQPLLNKHVTGETYAVRKEKLVELTDRIFDHEQRLAVRYAFGIEGGHHRQAQHRRAEALQAIPVSLRTLDRRENDGCRDMARFIIESSPQLSEAERQDEIDQATSMATRVADLEFLVLHLARTEVVMHSQLGWLFYMAFSRPLQYLKLIKSHRAIARAHYRDEEKWGSKLNALIERTASEEDVRAWKARFSDDSQE